MAIQPEAGVHALEDAVHEIQGLFRRVLRRLGLVHFRRMPAVVLVGAAVRVRQRLPEREGRPSPVLTEGGATFAIEGRIATGWRMGQQLGEVGVQFAYFPIADRAFEDVETAAPIGRVDLRVKATVVREPNRSPVSELECPRPSLIENNRPFVA